MRRYLPLLALTLLATPALAQDYSSMQARMERLERDLSFMQRQVYQGGVADPNASNAMPVAAGGGAGTAGLQTQIMQMQEEMRRLRGDIEQAQYKAQQALDAQKKYQEDVDFRLQQLERQATAPAMNPTEPVPMTDPAPAPMPAPAPAPRTEGFDINAGSGNEDIKAPVSTYQPAGSASAETPRDSYNRSFKLLNEAKYADAAAGFDQFTKKYPKDALVPNAYYWMGESYYARRDYSAAAEGFRKGYESNPKGQKAADNLLKLSLSLANLKRLDEACIVLKQVSAQYGSSNKTTAAKADSEYKRLGCA